MKNLAKTQRMLGLLSLFGVLALIATGTMYAAGCGDGSGTWIFTGCNYNCGDSGDGGVPCTCCTKSCSSNMRIQSTEVTCNSSGLGWLV